MKRATTKGGAVNEILFISIHALVKRATVEKGITSYDAQISIHALVKRATFVYTFIA